MYAKKKLNNKVISYYLKPFPGYWLKTTLELFYTKSSFITSPIFLAMEIFEEKLA
jgi:hypothetical protein